MFEKYRRTSWSAKLISFGSIILLSVAISYRFNYNIMVAVGVITGLGLTIHILATKPKTTLSIIVCFLQAAAVSYLAVLLGSVFASINLDPLIFAILIGSVFLTTSIIISYVAFRYSKIKVWLALAVSFLILDLSGFIISSYVDTDFIVSLLISSSAGLLAIALFSAPLFKRKTNETVVNIRESIRNSTAHKTAIEVFKKNNWDYEEKEGYQNVFLVKTPKVESIIFALNFSDPLSKSKKDVHYKGISLGNFFNDLIMEARKISVTDKIKKKNVSVVIMDTSNKYSLPNVKFEEIHLTAKNDSRDRKDRIIVSNNQGLVNYVESLKV